MLLQISEDNTDCERISMAKGRKRSVNKPNNILGGDTTKKLIILLSMILIGILLIAYRSNFEYWADSFISYNQILFALSLILFILIIIIVLSDFKNILKFELIGTIIVAVGVIILMLVPSGNYLGMGSIGGSSTILFGVGGIILIVGAIFLMRNGGYIGVCLLSLLIIMAVSAFYMMGDGEAIQYTENTFLMTNYAIILFIICFLLLIYNDLKFFYLAKLIREEKNLRKKKEYEKALSLCNRALLIYPFFATAWNNKGNLYINLGKKKDAMECYKKAIDINPDYDLARNNLKIAQKS
jgi:tetratricopeptide (TPR) repeat protein